jgi:hypothetical protein
MSGCHLITGYYHKAHSFPTCINKKSVIPHITWLYSEVASARFTIKEGLQSLGKPLGHEGNVGIIGVTFVKFFATLPGVTANVVTVVIVLGTEFGIGSVGDHIVNVERVVIDINSFAESLETLSEGRKCLLAVELSTYAFHESIVLLLDFIHFGVSLL